MATKSDWLKHMRHTIKIKADAYNTYCGLSILQYLLNSLPDEWKSEGHVRMWREECERHCGVKKETNKLFK